MTESEVRAMRDKVYGDPSTDVNWSFAKVHWMKPEEIAWLKEQCDKIKSVKLTELKLKSGRTLFIAKITPT